VCPCSGSLSFRIAFFAVTSVDFFPSFVGASDISLLLQCRNSTFNCHAVEILPCPPLPLTYTLVAESEFSTQLIPKSVVGHDPEPVPSSQPVSLRRILMLPSRLLVGPCSYMPSPSPRPPRFHYFDHVSSERHSTVTQVLCSRICCFVLATGSVRMSVLLKQTLTRQFIKTVKVRSRHFKIKASGTDTTCALT